MGPFFQRCKGRKRRYPILWLELLPLFFFVSLFVAVKLKEKDRRGGTAGYNVDTRKTKKAAREREKERKSQTNIYKEISNIRVCVTMLC